jgi:hypothetical protein
MPSSKTTLIQIIGRALRLHKLKIIAHVILPFSSKNDEGNINKFLRIMALNDNRITKSYQSKKLGGYISINKITDTNNENKKNNEKEDNNVELKFNMIFDGLGNLVNKEEFWMKKVKEIEKFIDENNKRPSTTSKNKYEIKLGQWICTQIQNYKNKTNIMSNTYIYEKWTMLITSEKYSKYLIKRNTWDINFEKVINYIDTNNKKPIHLDKNSEISRLERWILDQMKRSRTNIDNVSNKLTYKKWQTFITSDKYKKYFMNNTEIWNDNLEKVKNYMNLNKRKPNSHDKNIESKRFGTWIETQINQIKQNKSDEKTEIYNKWNNFITSDEYKQYFMNFDKKWDETLEKVKEFININNAKPTRSKTKPPETIRLGGWIDKQIKKYNNEEYIAKNKDFYNEWTEFITSDKYKKYFEK